MSRPNFISDSKDIITVLRLAHRKSLSQRNYAYVLKDAYALIHISKVLQVAITADNLLSKFCKLNNSLLIGAVYSKKDSTLLMRSGNKVVFMTQKPAQQEWSKYVWVALSRDVPL